MEFKISKEFILELEQLIESKNDQQLEALLHDLHHADIAEILDDLDFDEATYIFRILDSEITAEILPELEDDVREKILHGLSAKEIAEELGLYGELHRFIPVLAKLQGARITQVDVKHHARIHGKSKYGINRTFKVMSDLVLMVFMRKYLQKPMHLFGPIGFISLGIGILINMYLLILKILGHDIGGRPVLILGLILLLGGIQFITIGIVADINTRTYFESQNKKTYTVRKVFHASTQVEIKK